MVKKGINQQQWEYDGYILVGGLEHFLLFYSVGKIIERNGEIVHQQAMAKMRPEDMRGIFIWLVVWNHGIL